MRTRMRGYALVIGLVLLISTLVALAGLRLQNLVSGPILDLDESAKVVSGEKELYLASLGDQWRRDWHAGAEF